jgi:hypothetical protein
LAVGAVLFVAVFTGCAPTNSASSTESYSASTTVSSTPPSAPASQAAPDYRRLLIEPADINTAVDRFATRSSTTNPDGMHGVSALFVNQDDTRAIANSILILPDAAAATTTLNTTVSSIGKAVTGGSPSTVAGGHRWDRGFGHLPRQIQSCDGAAIHPGEGRRPIGI